MLREARGQMARGEDEAARASYFAILCQDDTNFDALMELAALAWSSGRVTAAGAAYGQAVLHHPAKALARVNLANLLVESGNAAEARRQIEVALRIDPELPPAHQAMARILLELDDPGAESHWHKGFSGHATVVRPYRGVGVAIPVLLLVAARGGNIPTTGWLDDHVFEVTAIHADFGDPRDALPPHTLIVNAIGDADLCATALRAAESMVASSTRNIVNPPAKVLATGRVENAVRLGGLPGVVTAKIQRCSREAILGANVAATDHAYPLLLRSPGYHTGRHFVRVDTPALLGEALAGLPGEEILAMPWIDTSGADGMARKYRVMRIDGVLYPVHLAISADWKVHYFSADMAANPAYREEERRFLDDMPTVLGPRAMDALTAIFEQLDLDYAGADFAVMADGSLLVFEANATMVVCPPGPEPIWDYRRRAASHALDAVRTMLSVRQPL